MNGPAHYRQAERLLIEAGGRPISQGAALIAAAQVHATLAQVAVTVFPRSNPSAWEQAINS